MPVSIQVTLDGAQIAGLLRRLEPAERTTRMRAAMTESVAFAVRRVVSKTPKKTGVLAASISGRVQSSVLGIVRSPLRYAPHVEFGTRPHTIRPRRARALFWPGAAHPVKSVSHPGTRGVGMFQNAAAEIGPAVAGIFARHLQP